MLTRRTLLMTSAAAALVYGSGLKAMATPGKIVGHAIRCVSHVLDGAVAVEEMEAIYLSDIVMPPEVAGVYSKFRAGIASTRPGGRLSADDSLRIDALLAQGVIRPRPAAMGPVGRRIWTRDGLPYWPPRLYGAMLTRVMESYERYV